MTEIINDQEIEYIDLDNLCLDPENPRLPHSLDKSNEKVIAGYIAKTTAIEDLMSAIAENGFFAGEPVIVVKQESKYLVVEGNRRLTAVKLLHDPDYIDRPSRRIREIAGSAANRPKSIPTIVRGSREEVLPYLGFRHISGVREWEPLSKARYMRQLLNSMTNESESPSERYATVAKKIGSRKDHIKRSLDALAH